MYGPVRLPGPDGTTAATKLRPEHLAYADWHFYTLALGDWFMPINCPCCRLQAWALRALVRARTEAAR